MYYSVWFENNNEDARFEYSTDSSEPEIVLTIKKNGETLLEQVDITRGGEWYVYGSKKINYFSYVIGDVSSEKAQYYYCLTDYYPEYMNYIGKGFSEINGGDEAFLQSTCNGDETCEEQIIANSELCDEKVANGEFEFNWGIWFNYISAEAGKTTTDTWEAIVTFKNLDTDQSINLGKKFQGSFLLYAVK